MNLESQLKYLKITVKLFQNQGSSLKIEYF